MLMGEQDAAIIPIIRAHLVHNNFVSGSVLSLFLTLFLCTNCGEFTVAEVLV